MDKNLKGEEGVAGVGELQQVEEIAYALWVDRGNAGTRTVPLAAPDPHLGSLDVAFHVIPDCKVTES
jgi:hypothetical protein